MFDLVHGNWSDWIEWSMCDKPCNNGSTTKTRICNNPTPQYGGNKCQGKSLETKTCNFHTCRGESNSPVDTILIFITTDTTIKTSYP